MKKKKLEAKNYTVIVLKKTAKMNKPNAQNVVKGILRGAYYSQALQV